MTDPARRQLERELRLIEKLKLAGYFLTCETWSSFAARITSWFNAEAILAATR